MDYHSVQVRKADVERLAREAGGNGAVAETEAQAAPPDEGAVAPDAHEADTKPQTTAPDAQEAGHASAGGGAVAAPPLSRRPAGHAA